MRLFIAINFNNQIKDQIQDIITNVKSSSTQGKFVSNEHMHLTLEFIGEVSEDKVVIIKNALNNISTKTFSLQLSNLGYFKRGEGNIYWIGIEENQNLLEAQSQIHNMLLKEGFELESREYKPHLTIGRKVLTDKDFNPDIFLDTLKELKINVDSIDLMKSEQIKGKLTYSVIYSKKL